MTMYRLELKGDDMNLIELEKKIKEHEVIKKFKDGVVDGFLHGTRDEKQSHHYYKQGYDFGLDLWNRNFLKNREVD